MPETLHTGEIGMIASDLVKVGSHGPVSISAVSSKSATAVVGGALAQGTKLLVVIYVARQFSISQFGLISFAMAVNAFILVVSNFGLPVFGSRAVAVRGGVPRGLLGDIACLRACLALTGVVVTVAFLYLVPSVSRAELLLVTIFGLSDVAQAVLLDWAFQGLHRQAASAILNFIWQAGWFALTALGIRLGMGVSAVPTALAAAGFVAASIGYLWLIRTGKIQSDAKDWEHVLRRSWEILKLAAPLGWGTLLVTILVWSDTIVVRLFRGERAVGLYAAGNRLALGLAMIQGLHLLGAFPVLSQASQEGPSRLKQCFQRCYDDMAMVYVPGSLWAVFYAREIILLIYKNPEYLAAVPVFQVFQFTFLLTALSTLFGLGALVASHRDKDYQKVLVLTTSVFLPMCVLFTAWEGNLGASFAAFVAQVVSSVIFLKRTRSVVQPKHAEAVLVPVFIGVTVGAVSKLVGLNLYWSAGVLGLVYVGMLSNRIRSIFDSQLAN
jgi:O-antigen/teichoic acid export membrane protein